MRELDRFASACRNKSEGKRKPRASKAPQTNNSPKPTFREFLQAKGYDTSSFEEMRRHFAVRGSRPLTEKIFKLKVYECFDTYYEPGMWGNPADGTDSDEEEEFHNKEEILSKCSIPMDGDVPDWTNLDGAEEESFSVRLGIAKTIPFKWMLHRFLELANYDLSDFEDLFKDIFKILERHREHSKKEFGIDEEEYDSFEFNFNKKENRIEGARETGEIPIEYQNVEFLV
jgi:hypothetical protein